MKSMYEHDERRRVLADLERESADRMFALQSKLRDIENAAMERFRNRTVDWASYRSNR